MKEFCLFSCAYIFGQLKSHKVERITTINEILIYIHTYIHIYKDSLSRYYMLKDLDIQHENFLIWTFKSLNIVDFYFKRYKILSVHAKYIFVLIIFAWIFK